ncbi:hypothetical protein B7988_10860 [Fibrobacter sp. UWB1]|nr:hypothetical protein B7988_10860 [Fibrobacter sp. UWB1]
MEAVMAWNKKEVKEYIACLLKASVAISSVTFLFGCGGDNDNKSSSVEMSPREVATVFELGACNADRRGDTVLVLDKSIEYMCVGNNWIDITTWPGVPTTKDTSQIPDTSKVDIPYKSLAEVQTIYELGACTEQREGIRILVLETGMGYLCHSTQWQQMTVQSSSSIVGDSTVASNDSKKSESSSSNSIEDPLCVNCSSSSSAKLTYIEVATKTKLGNCDTAKIDLRALVLADSSYYTCMEKGWVKDSVYLGYEVVTARVDLPNCNDGNVKQRMLVKRDSIFFVCDTGGWIPETTDGYVVNNISVMGSAHKGPFKFNSPLELREVLLRNDTLSYSGRKYIDEVSSNAGDFVIPKVRMIYPYAVLEVCGIWRNEVTGEWSKDSMTLRALTELSEKVNVNLLTHLEYDRAVNLIKKGYSVSAAKTQADYEIMTAFEITPTISNSEVKETFGSGADPTLLAMAALFIGNRSDAEISRTINSFKADIADDGVWNDEKAKAEMADWAEGFDYSIVRANVKSWNITAIPEFEAQLRTFWYNAYGLGGCGQNRYEVVAPVTNARSANYNVHYICKSSGWQRASDIEKDTYQWPKGDEGQVKKGDVTDTYYVYENGKWRTSANEVENVLGACVTNRDGEKQTINSKYYVCENKLWNSITAEEFGLGFCKSSNEGVVEKLQSAYYICKSKKWTLATALEYDTYKWDDGIEGEMKEGSVVATNHYVYENGDWRKTADEIEYEVGACVIERENEKIVIGDKYYICENKAWKNISEEEYGLGYCSSTNEGVVEKLDNVYYICKSSNWMIATALEYDTYGVACSKDGSIVDGNVVSENKYVCDAGSFRIANETDVSLNLGCVSYTEGEVINKLTSDEVAYAYKCTNSLWESSVISLENKLYDSRDGRIYKTATIGKQVWMAENLNYADSISYPGMKTRNWCYGNYPSRCANYGRLYTWAAAMDSAGTFSENGKECGFRKTCSHTRRVRGICPEGWHLPDTTEWNTLFSAVGSFSTAGKMLKSTSGWQVVGNSGYNGNGMGAYGFDALPGGGRIDGYFHNERYSAFFWCATEKTDNYAYHVYFSYSDDSAGRYYPEKDDGYSVRCVKD